MTFAISPSQTAASRRVAFWLFAMCGLLCLMVTVGGATRLTDSGLSITEWRPITGAVPPLSEAEWRAELEKYRQIPEYRLVNKGMTLDEFKQIYWWEWGHRFLGRLIGVAFLVPLIVFVLRRDISRPLGLKLSGIFVLGGLQGVLGWYMVQSGLTHRVDVSQYRLAAHLGLAIILLGLMFWTALDLIQPRRAGSSRSIFGWSLALVGLVFAQMLLGAFVAGLRAGRIFTTWPLMDGRLVPEGYASAAATLSGLFDNPAAAQFNHRIGAYAVFLAAAAYAWAARRSLIAKRARMVFAVVSLQVVFGVWTLVSATPIGLGLLHQLGALMVFLASLYATHGARTAPGP